MNDKIAIRRAVLILSLIDQYGPIPAHKLARMIGMNPATVAKTIKQARLLLDADVASSNMGYESVVDWGILDRDKVNPRQTVRESGIDVEKAA